MYAILEKIDSLPLEKSQLCMLGQFTRAFLEKDAVITKELIPFLEKAFSDSEFCLNIFHLYIRELKNEKRQIEETMQNKINIPSAYLFYKPQLDIVSNKLKVKDFDELMEFVKGEFYEYTGILYILSNSYSSIHGSIDDSYLTKNYKYYYIGQILYDEYRKNKSRLEFISQKSADHIINEYKKIGIDINNEDSQFKKYKLVNLKDSFRIRNDKDSQTIVDSRVEKYFWISVPRKLLFSIEKLIEDKLISKISFRVDGITELIPVMEDMEFGSPLKIEVISLPDLSKFYSSEKYDDNMWVVHDKSKQSLTFEEHLEDFELIGEEVITQVIHLEYQIENEKYFINHIDHEFIVYTFEQYTARVDNSNVKGYKRIKTFKIDASKIPFNYKHDNEYFLLQVLDAYFKNKKLVNEYFSEMEI